MKARAVLVALSLATLLTLASTAKAGPPAYSASHQHNYYPVITESGELVSVYNDGSGKLRRTTTTGEFQFFEGSGYFEESVTDYPTIPANLTVLGNHMDVFSGDRLLLYFSVAGGGHKGGFLTENDQLVTFGVADEELELNFGEINDSGSAAVTLKEPRGIPGARFSVPQIVSPAGVTTEILSPRVSAWGPSGQSDFEKGILLISNQATATAINSSNAVVCSAEGAVYDDLADVYRFEEWSFVSQGGAILFDELPPGATDINKHNEVVGYDRDSGRTWIFLPGANYGLSAGVHTISEGFGNIYSSSVIVKISKSGTVVWKRDTSSRPPKLWKDGSLHTLSDLVTSDEQFEIVRVNDMSDEGQILIEDKTPIDQPDGSTFDFPGSRILSAPSVRIEINKEGELKPGEEFLTSVIIDHVGTKPTTYRFPQGADGIFFTASPADHVEIAESDLPESIELSKDEPRAVFAVPCKALKRGFVTLDTSVEATTEFPGGPETEILTATKELLVEPLEFEVTITERDYLLNQVPESAWGERAKAINDDRRLAMKDPYMNLMEIELKITNKNDDPVTDVNIGDIYDIHEYIQSLDPDEPGVPLTPIWFYSHDGEKNYDLAKPENFEVVPTVDLEKDETITFAWVVDAFDANSDPEVDDSRPLEFTPLIAAAIGGKNFYSVPETEFSVIDKPLLEWGVRPKNGVTSYISGRGVRADGYLENISARDGGVPVDIRVVIYPKRAGSGNLGGGFMFKNENAGQASPTYYLPFDLPAEGPGSILNLSAIFRTAVTVMPTAGKVQYGVKLFAVRKDPDAPNGEIVTPAHEQVLVKEGWSEDYDVEIAADPPSFSYQDEIYALGADVPLISGIWPFLVGVNVGLTVDFVDGIFGLWEFMLTSGEATLNTGANIIAWEFYTARNMWNATWNEDPAARAALLQELWVQYETFKNLGIMTYEAGERLPETIEELEVVAENAAAAFFDPIVEGNLEEMQIAAGRFLGANPDIVLEPFVVATLYPRLSRASLALANKKKVKLKKLETDVTDNFLAEAARAKAARDAASLDERLAEAVALGKNPATALLPGDILSDSKLLDIYGVTREQKKSILKIARDNGVIVTFRSRNPISVKILEEGRGYPKPQALKHKTVNRIDIDYLGYRHDAEGVLELVEPRSGLLDANGRAFTGDNLEAALDLEMNALAGRIGNNDLLKKEVRERMKNRAKEWNELFLDQGLGGKTGRIEQKITTAFEAELQSPYAIDQDKVKQVGSIDERIVSYEPITDSATGQRRWEMKMEGPTSKITGQPGPPKSVTGDVDFMSIVDENNGIIRDTQKRIEIYTQLEAVMDMQHGESYSFFLQKAREKHLRSCSYGAEDAEALVAISGFGDGKPRAAYFVDNLSIIDNPGCPNASALPKRKTTQRSLIDFVLRRNEPKEIRRVDPSGEFMFLYGVEINIKPNLDFVNIFQPKVFEDSLADFFKSPGFIIPTLMLRMFDSEDKEAVFLNEGGQVIQASPKNGDFVLRKWTQTSGWQETTMSEVLADGDPDKLELAPMSLSPTGRDAGNSILPIRAQDLLGVNGDFFEPGQRIVINPGGDNEEILTIRALGSLIFATPLQFDHPAGEVIAALGRDPDDYDGDGLSDEEEENLGTNPKEMDSDFDGLFDQHEIAAGTNPQDPNTGFDLTSMTTVDDESSVTVTWNGNPGTIYQIEATTDLEAGDWQVIDEVTASPDVLQMAAVDNPFEGEPAAFFRVRVRAEDEGLQ